MPLVQLSDRQIVSGNETSKMPIIKMITLKIVLVSTEGHRRNFPRSFNVLNVNVKIIGVLNAYSTILALWYQLLGTHL